MPLLIAFIITLVLIAAGFGCVIKPVRLDWSARIVINPKQIFIMIAPGLDDDPLPGNTDPPSSEE